MLLLLLEALSQQPQLIVAQAEAVIADLMPALIQVILVCVCVCVCV